MTPLLTVSDIADLLAISQSLVYRLVADGELRCYRIGRGALRFRQEDVETYLTACTVAGRERGARTPSRLRLKHLT